MTKILYDQKAPSKLYKCHSERFCGISSCYDNLPKKKTKVYHGRESLTGWPLQEEVYQKWTLYYNRHFVCRVRNQILRPNFIRDSETEFPTVIRLQNGARRLTLISVFTFPVLIETSNSGALVFADFSRDFSEKLQWSESPIKKVLKFVCGEFTTTDRARVKST